MMAAILYYMVSAVLIGRGLPRVRACGEVRLTVLWVVLWLLALGVGAIYFLWNPDWGLADLAV